ncbi:hypothetical protein [Tautonia sociabilis]|uniref:Uncharacterized protein n=1 Tax=Tautonia sociabilis TaxID=2080755 RepID=A0A432MEA1_9BACT|nr:hypothetical protein [Tautonia sociabilis]RUL83644.1 hypothetical protein TsocGM_21665 [Tautonia sociabilis]
MSRRPIGPPAVLGVVALLATVGAPEPSPAADMVAFRLKNTTDAPVSEMYFTSVPKGTILPPVIGTNPDGSPIEGSPMKALPSSVGIDVSSSYVLLTDDPADTDLERMFLLFGYEPDPNAAAGAVPFLPLVDDAGNRVGRLEPGGTFDFELDLAQGSLAYLLKSAIDGLTLEVLGDGAPTDPGSDPIPGGDPGTPIPEPGALLLWSVIGFGALALARRRLPSRAFC